MAVQEQRISMFHSGQGWDQSKELKDEADRPPPHIGALVAIELADIFAIDIHCRCCCQAAN